RPHTTFHNFCGNEARRGGNMMTSKVCAMAPDTSCQTRSGAQETRHGSPLRGNDMQRVNSAIHDYFRERPYACRPLLRGAHGCES
ncbi:MAG: hypothetical protein ACPL7J_05370, partial [Desulfomonilaceae bacterium]